MSYFGLKNNVTTAAFPVSNPETFQPQIPADIVTREDLRKWASKPTTDHLFLSGYEAVNPNIRVNLREGNPPFRMLALIVDYDALTIDAAKDVIVKMMADVPDLLPSWIVATRSNHRRLVWEFEKPLGLNAEELTEAFLQVLKKELRLLKLLPGLDEPAYMNVTTYYEVGVKWTRINPNPLASGTLENWFFQAAQKSSRKSAGTSGLPEIPMDRIYDKICDLFPGRWPKGAPFIEGCRGPAVWDPSASNPTSCVFYKHGVYRYSSDKIFHSYSEILGKDFTRQWEADKIGSATHEIYYAGKAGYYRRLAGDIWVNQPAEDITRYLLTAQNLSKKAPTVRDGSEIDHALCFIQESRFVDGAIPFAYDPENIKLMGAYRFLNTSRLKVMQPAEADPNGPLKWGQGFPWIAKWLGGFFDSRRQLVYFLAWLKLFYESARQGALTPGHAVFMVGKPNTGKTLLNAVWLPMLMGGGSDASDFLVEGKGFNKHLLEVAHWHIDDSQAATNQLDHRKFTERVKKLIANPKLQYHPKYVDAQELPWRGRLLVTLNGDPESLQMIPDLDRNIEDKLIVFQCADRPNWKFTSRYHSETTLRAESPAFLRWLCDWKPRAKLVNPSHRYGMKNFIHPTVREISVMTGFQADLLDVLEIMWKTEDCLIQAARNPGYWEGSAAELSVVIASHPVVGKLLDQQSARGIGRRLGKLSKIQGSRIVAGPKPSHKAKPQSYRIFPPET